MIFCTQNIRLRGILRQQKYPVFRDFVLDNQVMSAILQGIVYRPKKHFKNEQRSKDAAAKKDLIQVE